MNGSSAFTISFQRLLFPRLEAESGRFGEKEYDVCLYTWLPNLCLLCILPC
jgi:hypothetical protein